MSYGRRPPAIEGMTSLKVDNLSYRMSPDDLRRTFEKYGDVGDIYIPRDRFTRDSRGFAFIRFYDKRDADDAMDAMDGAYLDGREIRVQMARYGRPSEPRRGPPPRGRYNSRRSRSRSRSRSPDRSRRRRSRSRSKSKSKSKSRSRSRSRSRSPSQEKRSRSRSEEAEDNRRSSPAPDADKEDQDND